MRRLLRRHLSKAGHSVVSAAGGREAIELFGDPVLASRRIYVGAKHRNLEAFVFEDRFQSGGRIASPGVDRIDEDLAARSLLFLANLNERSLFRHQSELRKDRWNKRE